MLTWPATSRLILEKPRLCKLELKPVPDLGGFGRGGSSLECGLLSLNQMSNLQPFEQYEIGAVLSPVFALYCSREPFNAGCGLVYPVALGQHFSGGSQ